MSAEGLKPSQKHKEKITKWTIPSSREELDSFLWLTPFLRIFVPGRGQLVMDMKKAYLEQVADELKVIGLAHTNLHHKPQSR